MQLFQPLKFGEFYIPDDYYEALYKKYKDMLDKLFQQSPNIEELSISYYYLRNISNFDGLERLRKLSLFGQNYPINLDFFKSLFECLSERLNELSIHYMDLDEKKLAICFNHNFSNLNKLEITNCQIFSLEKELFNGRFPMLERLEINSNYELANIKNEAFSDLKNLKVLVMKNNKLLTNFDPKVFIGLGNLEELDLSSNKLIYFNSNIVLDHIVKIKKIDLNGNKILNQETISDQFKDSGIEFIF